jgi:hypothetical protein
MLLRKQFGLGLVPLAALPVLFAVLISPARAQGPAPETAPTLFPGGALISYNSAFTTRGPIPDEARNIPPTARPTFSHDGIFNFTWGFYRNFDVSLGVPIVTNDFKITGTSAEPTVGGTGLGDILLLVKCRFLRRDSKRGTTQASVTIGPKFPSGATSLTDTTGKRLPATLQLGSGSTDLFLEGNFTYTGLFGLKRLVADEDFHTLWRSRGTQATRLGSDLESRFWLSYRPYESSNVGREWFIGPELTWLHSQDDNVGGLTQKGSGGDALLAGVTTYFGVRPGTHLWFGMDWDTVPSTSAAYMPVRRHISFGITQQFRLRF